MRRTFAALGEDPEDDALHAVADRRQAGALRRRPRRPRARRARASGSSPPRSSCRTSSAITRTRSSRRRGSGPGLDVGRGRERVRRGPARPARARPDGRRPRGLARDAGSGSTRRRGGPSAERASFAPPAGSSSVPTAPATEVLARPPPGIRRLDVPEREGRAGRERRGVRRTRGRGGDGPASARSDASCPRPTTSTRRGGRSACATGVMRSSAARCVRPRGRRRPLGDARRGGGAPQLRARSRACWRSSVETRRSGAGTGGAYDG